MVRISNQRIDLENARIDQAVIKDYRETLVGGASGTNSGTSYSIDLSTGNVFNLILNNTCTLSFTNPTASGTACSFVLYLWQDSTGSRTVTWPSSVAWPGGTAPTLTTTASHMDVFSFLTIDGGSTWFGFTAAQNF